VCVSVFCKLQKAELSYYDRLGVNRLLFAMTELKISSLCKPLM
jgi:hypothetical protein